MINRFLQEETIITGSVNDIVVFQELYNKYCEWKCSKQQEDQFILTTPEEFLRILKKYSEISFYAEDPTYGIPSFYSGLKLKNT